MRGIFIILWTLPVLWLCSVHAQQSRPRPSPVLKTASAVKGWPESVRGLGTEVDAAKDDAYEQARKAIVAFLGKQRPPMRSWQPTRAEIEKYVEKSEAGADVPLENLGVAKSWQLTLREPVFSELRALDQTAYNRAQEQARRGRTQERVVLIGRFMIGALAGLVLLIGAARVSENMPRRYARLVLAGMIGVVACILVGLLLVQ